jgi:hypothetical protein
MDTASSNNNPNQPFDTNQNEEKFLPKEPLDLPRTPLDLPLPEKEISAHATPPSHHKQEDTYSEEQEAFPYQGQSYDMSEEAPYEVKTLLSWTAPGRPFRTRGKEYFASIILITFLIEIIVFLFGEYLLMVVILSLAFVTVALAIAPPHDYHYRISTEGVTIEDHFYLWQELYDFYFKRRDNKLT